MKTAFSFSPMEKNKILSRTVAVAGLILGAFAPAAHGEFVFSIFSGLSTVQDNDLTLHQAGGTVKIHDVSYKTRDFESPLYYGGRLSYFLPQQSHWGFGVEFFHT